MIEKIIKDYLNGGISADILRKDFADKVSDPKGASSYNIDNVEVHDKLVITANHLIKICLDAINYRITLNDFKVIILVFEASPHFTWDTTDSKDNVGNIISNLLALEYDKSATIEYINYCAYYLETGEHM